MPRAWSFLITQSAIGPSSWAGIALTVASFLTSASRRAGEVIGVDDERWLGITLPGVAGVLVPVPVLGVCGAGGVVAAWPVMALLLLLLEPQPAAARAATAISTATRLNRLLTTTLAFSVSRKTKFVGGRPKPTPAVAQP